MSNFDDINSESYTTDKKKIESINDLALRIKESDFRKRSS
jgi:hypothetical protein